MVVSHVWFGHIPGYHSLCIERLIGLGAQVVSVIPPYAEYSGEELTFRFPCLNPQPKAASKTLSAPRFGLLRSINRRFGLYSAYRARSHWHALTELIRTIEFKEHIHIDFVFLVYLGLGFLVPGVSKHVVEKALQIPWAGIWNGPNPGRTPESPAIARLWPVQSALNASNCFAVWVPHPKLVDRVKSHGVRAKVYAMPEIADLSPPIAEPLLVERINKHRNGRKLVSLLGSISVRKGVFEFIEIARLATSLAPSLCFVVAGEFTDISAGPDYDRIKSALEAAPENLLFLPGRISDGSEFNWYVSISDIVYALYRDFPFQSNLLTKAAAFRKPVLVARGGVMEHSVKDFRLGSAVTSNDIQEALAAIENLINLRDSDGSNLVPRFNDFVLENDVKMLDPLFSECLNSVKI